MMNVWRITGRIEEDGKVSAVVLYALSKPDGAIPNATRVLGQLRPGCSWQAVSGIERIGEVPTWWDSEDPTYEGLTMQFTEEEKRP